MCEYWIDEEGQTTYCDGDAGVDIRNHSMVVVDHCRQIAISKLELANDDGLADMVIAAISQHSAIFDIVAFRCSVNDELDNLINEEIITAKEADNIWDTISDKYHIERWVIDIITGSHPDPRVIGIMKFNWIRVADNNFEAKSLNKHTLSRIQDFINDENLSGTFTLEIANHNGKRFIAYDLDASDFNSINSIIRRSRVVGV